MKVTTGSWEGLVVTVNTHSVSSTKVTQSWEVLLNNCQVTFRNWLHVKWMACASSSLMVMVTEGLLGGRGC